jgi:hydrogenase-4 component B
MNASIWNVLPIGPAWQPAWRLDGPAWLFLAPVLFVSALSALYAPAYLRQERYRHESATRYWLMYALFVLGMTGTVLAADLLLFLVCWEVMTLASYVLVAHETREPAVARAAFKYFFMTHVGTGCLLFAIVVLGAQGGSFAIARLPDAFRALAAAGPLALHGVLALLFVGFATKAGLYPFGDWLPDAHPAAPAPVSAVLSGVMVKLGLYGLLRVFVQALATADPGAAAAWGWVIGAFGLLSALAGGGAACTAGDTKVLLAYSSIAQSGIIALGFGAALVLEPLRPALATLALLGACFHVVGDAVVKALLFLVAGALQWRTGSRRLEDLGGLFEAMPVTGWTALAGSFAIAGFPAFTAFTGKWLLLQSTVLSRVPLVSLAGLGLLVASLLSMLYAVKFFAAAFANRPMRPGRLDVPASMCAAEIVLACAALAIGLAPGGLLALLARLLRGVPAMAGADPLAWGSALLPASGAFAPLLLVVFAAWALAFVRACLGPGASPAARAVWMGGVPAGPGALRIHPLGFYSPMREALRRLYPVPHVRHMARPAWVGTSVDLDRWFYAPALHAGRRVVASLRRLHTGVPNVYLAWQLAGALSLALLLLFLLRHRGAPWP